MTHYRLILTKDCQMTDLTSRQMTALARTSSYSKLQTRPIVRENLKEIETLVTGPRWAPDTKTDWPTDCRSQCDFDFDFDLCL
jgi:hypothetical protein